MREKIEQLSNGIFEYELPSIILSEDKIIKTVETGKVYHGSFTIKNTENKLMKGVLYASGNLLEIEEEEFVGEEVEINYSFNATYIKAGEIAKGNISILSNYAEIVIPYEMTIEVPYCVTSMGKIKDLFHFANLAKENQNEAIKLFKSEEFSKIFLSNDEKNLILYKGLMKSISKSHAMEEFLIAIHKKLRINLAVDRTNIAYAIKTQESFMDKVVLTKDQWGHQEIKISSDMPFLIPEHKIVWSDNFIGSTYQLDYLIDPTHMRCGTNVATIKLETTYQTINIHVECEYEVIDKNENQADTERRIIESKLEENYLNFRLSNLKLEEYVADSEVILELLNNKRSSFVYGLFKLHLKIISDQTEVARELISKFSEKKEELKEGSYIYYAIYLYLKALLSKDHKVISDTVEEIREIYKRENYDWRLLWILFYLDSKYDKNPALKIEELKKYSETECRSPIMYYEICSVYNKQPTLLNSLSKMEFQALYWGIRNSYLSKDIAEQFTYLVSKEKKYRPVIYFALCKLYDIFESDEILNVICSLLIKAHKTDTKYFKWYSKAVAKQQKITELYEYYMYSIDESKPIKLPSSVLLYFEYNSNLSDQKKAYLYAEIIHDRDKSPIVYQNYKKEIKKFAITQITKHVINENLAIIYEDVLRKDMLTENLAIDLSEIMFYYVIKCNNSNMKGVCVIHKELDREVYVPFSKGKAKIAIFTEDAEIILVDKADNRYSSTVEYTLFKLMRSEEYINECYSLYQNNNKVLLNISEKVENYQKYDEKSIQIRKKVLEVENLRENYHRNYVQTLIQYYYDNFEGELLEFYLLQIDLQYMNVNDRTNMMEYMIIRDLYDKTMESIDEFGYKELSVNRLIKLCSRLISRDGIEKENKLLTKICYYVFDSGKYDDLMLKYLMLHYSGTVHELFTLWEAATNFEIDTVLLEEKLLAQILFTESYLKNSYDIFCSYYSNGCNKQLIRAFLSYNAYKYLVHNRVIQVKLFDIMKKELIYEENEVCLIALLKYYSTKDELTEIETKKVENEVNSFIKKGKIFPFFKEFRNKITMPSEVCDKYYVEYIANPDTEVTIEYMISNENSEFVEETMENLYMGIRVKAFVLFYNEEIQYFIKERSKKGISITESMEAKIDDCMEEEVESRYHDINLMLMTKEMKDEKTLFDLMEHYIKTNCIIDSLFKPL